MTTLFYFIVGSLLFFLAWILQKISDKIRGLAPGPFRVPLIGNSLQVILSHPTNPALAIQKLSKYYGDIIHIQFGLTQAVVVHGIENIQHVFHTDDFLERADDDFAMDRTFGKPLGLLTARLDIWKESRRFTLKTLKDFGFGVKSSMEASLQTELQELCELISSKALSNERIEVVGLFDASVINVVWSMVIGKRFHFNDPTLTHLVHLTHMFFEPEMWRTGLLLSYPFLARFAPKLVAFDKQSECTRGFQTFLRNILSEIRSDGKYCTNPENFTEVFLQKIDTRKSTGTIEDVVYSDENLITILYDLLAGSSESTGKYLAFAILFMILNPEAQEKVREEIDSVIGMEKLPELSDRERMPYTVATIHEINRLSSLFPMIPSKVYRDTRIGKYSIPKGTHVIVNAYSAAMDEKYWEDPHTFQPERFICPSTGKIINTEKLFSFGAGKRSCIAEAMARATIFIIFTGLLQKFKFKLNPDERKPSGEVVCGLNNSPNPFTVIAAPRK